MIAERSTDVQVQRTLGGEKIAMGIHVDALGHIMNVLTDLYSDPESAVIREYATNALDAHIEAGQKRPIEVTLPTALSQFFTVRDFGVGLSFDDIKAIYSQYGASTKRDSNDVVGMLGLGCKSALTYTDQFILVSVKNGERVQVAISRDEDGTGGMTVVGRTKTDDPDGTTIQVPAKLHNAFASKAERFFRWWEPGTVLVNGKQPQPVEGLRVTDDLMMIEENQDWCIMGNVAYPVEQHFASGLGYGSGVAMRVPIGSVNFTPSRESLNYNPVTKATLTKMQAKWRENIPLALQREVDAAKTHREALRLMLKWSRQMPSHLRPAGGFTYKGETIPTTLRSESELSVGSQDGSGASATMVLVPGDSHVLSRHQRVRTTNIESVIEGVILHGWDRPSFTPGQKKKMNKWAVDKGLRPKHYVLLKDKPDADATKWLDSDRLVPWSEVEAIKLPRAVSNGTTLSGRIPGSYDFYDASGYRHGVEGDKIDQSQPIFYGDSYTVGRYNQALRQQYPRCTVVVLTSNRVAKFTRNVPAAKTCDQGLREAAAKWWAGVGKLDRQALAMHDSSIRNSLRAYHNVGVDDPDVVEAAKIAVRPIDKLLIERKAYKLVNIANPEVVNDPLDKYPLLHGNFYGAKPDVRHRVLYINAVYAARQAGADL